MAAQEELAVEKEQRAKSTPGVETHHLTPEELQKKISYYEGEMKRAAKELQFEEAARLRDLMRRYQQLLLA